MSQTTPSFPPTSTGTSRSRWLALAVLSTAMLMTILDGSIVTVAMPAIQQDLGFSPAGLSWTVNAYLIAFGGLLLLPSSARQPDHRLNQHPQRTDSHDRERDGLRPRAADLHR